MSATAGSITDEQFTEEGLKIVREAQAKGLTLRLLGSVAIRLRCGGSEGLYREAKRPLTDLDFMSYRACNADMPRFFEALGYEPDRAVLRHFGHSRQVYWSTSMPGLHCDVFFDKLSFCHDIDFQGRLDSDAVTIRLTDMLLEKMQIVEINEKDLKDAVILLREHPVGSDESDEIDGQYIAQLLSRDWGFWYTVTTNLKKVDTYAASFDALPPEDREGVTNRIGELLRLIDEKPKTTGWKVRAKVGTRKQWYRHVEEVSL